MVAAAFSNFSPFVLALMIGWVASVCVHEFAHALTAYWAGDRSVRQRGYLSFNPLYYIHPVYSILLPAIFLMMGGVPLPGGAVYIDSASLKKRSYSALVSAAGPVSNVLMFLVIAVIIHPSVGLAEQDFNDQPNWVRFLGALAVLQLFGIAINLIPVPPFDGFGIIEPFLDHETQSKMRQPQLAFAGIILVVAVTWIVPGVMQKLFDVFYRVTDLIGLPWDLLYGNFNRAFFGA